MRALYATYEQLKLSMDFAETARNRSIVLDELAQASDSADRLCQRRFDPLTQTRYFDWPNDDQRGAPSWRIWLDGDRQLIELASLSAGGTTIDVADTLLEPANDGPPYNRLELNLSTSAVFGTNGTHQRAIAATGLWAGARVDEESAGTLAEALDSTETGVDVSDSSTIGIGSLVKVDSERMLVTNKSWLTSGQTLQTSITADRAITSVAVTSGAGFNADELILVDSERMRIVDIAGNTLSVKRAEDGSTLAAHTSGATIYVPRTLTVTRGAQGSTAATHSTSTAILRWVPPPLINELTIGYAEVGLLQRGAGFARMAGQGENAREARGAGLADIVKRVRESSYARKARHRAV